MTATGEPITRQATCVAIDGRGVLIEGPPGSGKTSLALELIDRGALLVGDDGVLLRTEGSRLIASPHPRTRGMIEVRNLGILEFPCTDGVPLALALTLDAKAPRFIERAGTHEIAGIALPHLRTWPEGGPLAIKAELALRHFGLHF
ncbi:Hpr(Ser) kinase/phosphatase [Novosphingobium mathurense]|uniref:Hpr(Ser) kinase/phosphatase n=2 Tax=Novosphingobium mathurense TaxID=428990 RepID=A0A1U6H1N6_9SPHN|nr:HPr kinase/phosphatase C-terminal domain-containing protein [Novosphingobium sp. KN65.2]CDO34713.1 Putative HPr kinase/phosphorylase [Novosphingobium sp. KN65.2]SLJ89711.1 Hpr(Ser) kinase/phosphatase [Novosphingobium mathurense]